jgi:3-deoxy-D-manno-octulosonate 8-phosphate phosphatase (KDO 8-P phosphatase)
MLLKPFIRLYWNLRLPPHKVKLFLTDVDGVMTDGGMYYTENGDEFKKFQVQDGMGLLALREKGLQVGIVTAEDRHLNRRRAEKLKIQHYYPGEKDKLTRVKQICQQLNIRMDEVAFIGDDINDLEVLQGVGFRACPSNARPEIKSISSIKKLSVKGGDGAVRAWIDFLKDLGRI